MAVFVMKRDSFYLQLRFSDHTVTGRSVTSMDNPLTSVFIYDQQQVVDCSKLGDQHKAVAEDIFFMWQKIKRKLTEFNEKSFIKYSIII